ncbi:MAG: DUF465 domain-containing protein [Acidobacteria bacterium RBG_16_68_9]|nr:MAG: DUF465 domain-containing protein [Acidobacteria bacterium RBG_16_68_9]
MEKQDEELIHSLLDRNTELRQYYEEHLELERQLDRLREKSHLTPEEEIERKRIQKVKLAGKDRIMEILGRYRSGVARV